MRWWRRYRRMKWALQTIGTHCTHYTGSFTCQEDENRSPGARYGDEAWCDGCIARAGLQ